MASADGRITIEIELDDGTVQRGLADIGNQADKSGSKLGSAFGKAGKSLKVIGTIAAGAVAGVGALYGAVGALSIPLVQAAAAGQALDSQFTQVFGSLEEAADKAINTIATTTGIANGRLKGSFLQIAAFAKTTGVDTQSALDLSSRALSAAADSAAFYDRSLESTTESLQSFLKGNFENDSALGISATETTRNAVATRLFAQEFKELSEAQKQVALLTMVEEGNQLSGALGQASRESDGLENVLGNLKNAVAGVKRALGDAILDTAINSLKTLTKVIKSIDTKPLAAGLTFVVEKLGELYSFMKPVLLNIASFFLQTIVNIKNVWEQEGQNILKRAKVIFTNIYTEVTSIVSGITPIVKNVLSNIMSFWKRDGEKMFKTTKKTFTQVYAVVKDVLERVFKIVNVVLTDITAIWNKYGADIQKYTTTILGTILVVFKFVLPAIEFVVKTVWGIIVDIITGALDVIIGVVKIFSGLFTLDFKKMWDGIKQLFTGAVKLILGIISISFVGAIRAAMTNFFKFIIGLVRGQWTSIVNIFKGSTSSITSTISSWVINVVRYFRNLGTNARNIVVGLWNGLSSVFSVGTSNALRFVSQLKDKIVRVFRSINLVSIGKDIIKGLINGIGSLASSVVDTVKKLVKKIPKAIRDVLDINSPSRVTTRLGEYTGEGIAVGLNNTTGEVLRASKKLALSAIPNNLVNRLSGSSVNVGRLSSGGSALGTSTPVTSSVNNSKTATYNINVQNDQTAELERTMRRIQFGY